MNNNFMMGGNNIMQMLMSGMNPNQIMQQMVQQNPQARVILNQMQQSNMSPKDYVMQLAKQNNVNINPMLNMLRQKGFKF